MRNVSGFSRAIQDPYERGAESSVRVPCSRAVPEPPLRVPGRCCGLVLVNRSAGCVCSLTAVVGVILHFTIVCGHPSVTILRYLLRIVFCGSRCLDKRWEILQLPVQKLSVLLLCRHQGIFFSLLHWWARENSWWCSGWT